VCKSVELLEGWHEFLEEEKENGLQRATSAAAELANDQAEPEFQSVKRVRHVEPHFHHEAHDEPVTAAENKLELNCSTCYALPL
jgi:predicted NAD/FAD-dependent oxidoreductase